MSSSILRRSNQRSAMARGMWGASILVAAAY
jgi:hypothetical protein